MTKKIGESPALGGTRADDDKFELVDVSDTVTDSDPTGSTKFATGVEVCPFVTIAQIIDALEAAVGAVDGQLFTFDTSGNLTVFGPGTVGLVPVSGGAGVEPTFDQVPTAGIKDNAVTLAKLAGGTDGGLIANDDDGDPSLIVPVTAGFVLTDNGPGFVGTYQAASGGGAAGLSVKKNTAGTINKGESVYAVGISGSTILVELADADIATQVPIGIATEAITDTVAGKLALPGQAIAGLDTSGLSVGDVVYLSSTPGAFTKTPPAVATIHKLAKILFVDASTGQIIYEPEAIDNRLFFHASIDPDSEGAVNGVRLCNVTIPEDTDIVSIKIRSRDITANDTNYWRYRVSFISAAGGGGWASMSSTLVETKLSGSGGTGDLLNFEEVDLNADQNLIRNAGDTFAIDHVKVESPASLANKVASFFMLGHKRRT